MKKKAGMTYICKCPDFKPYSNLPSMSPVWPRNAFTGLSVVSNYEKNTFWNFFSTLWMADFVNFSGANFCRYGQNLQKLVPQILIPHKLLSYELMLLGWFVSNIGKSIEIWIVGSQLKKVPSRNCRWATLNMCQFLDNRIRIIKIPIKKRNLRSTCKIAELIVKY